MSEANGTNGTNGHSASLGDVLGRVSKLETSVAKLETGMVALQNDMHRIETGQNQILNAVGALSDRQSNSGKTNWVLIVGVVGVSITFVTALGGLFISPLQVKDAYTEARLQALEADNRAKMAEERAEARTARVEKLTQDADERAIRENVIRMQERELLRREMGK